MENVITDILNPGKLRIVLASQSPRRRELLSQLGLSFEVASKDVDESFPPHLHPADAARYIAERKAREFSGDWPDALVITADTIVTIDGQILGKPADAAAARGMLHRLSGRAHEVITAVAFSWQGQIHVFHETTEVRFRALATWEIEHYITNYRPFDKAGAYGIQEWIGMAAIETVTGSYTNVVGLPTARVYQELQRIAGVLLRA